MPYGLPMRGSHFVMSPRNPKSQHSQNINQKHPIKFDLFFVYLAYLLVLDFIMTNASADARITVTQPVATTMENGTSDSKSPIFGRIKTKLNNPEINKVALETYLKSVQV